jgi:predicted kinase
MQEVLILSGLPASGKSTYAKELMEKNPGKFKRISKDSLRDMLDNGKYSKEREKFILGMRDNLIISSLISGYSVIVDDTNLHPKHEEQIKFILEKNDMLKSMMPSKPKITIKEFDIDIKECIDRDRLRGKKSVGDKVIWDMYNRYLKKDNPIIEENPELPNAIICDLDGTLAILNGRNPYDASTCVKDGVNEVVRDIILQQVNDCHIIFVTGREDKYRGQTRIFLLKAFTIKGKYEKFSNFIYMRKTGDNRKDYIIKKEIYEEHIKGKYNIKLVLDDRPQVIKMWKKEGLFTLDCNQDPHLVDF